MTLRGLIEAVERGDDFGIIPNAQAVLGKFDPNYGVGETVCSAFHGSLDAAKRLHDALLPGWAVFVGNTDGEPGPFTAAARNPADETIAQAENADPARAWLLVILRALEGEP